MLLCIYDFLNEINTGGFGKYHFFFCNGHKGTHRLSGTVKVTQAQVVLVFTLIK